MLTRQQLAALRELERRGCAYLDRREDAVRVADIYPQQCRVTWPGRSERRFRVDELRDDKEEAAHSQ